MDRSTRMPPVGVLGASSRCFLRSPGLQSGPTPPKRPFPKIPLPIHWTFESCVCQRENTSNPSFLQHNKHQGTFQKTLFAAGSMRNTCLSCFSFTDQKVESLLLWGGTRQEGRALHSTHSHTHCRPPSCLHRDARSPQS